MRNSFRASRVVLCLVLSAAATACAGLRFQPEKVRAPGVPPDETSEFEIVADGNGCKKKSVPDAIYAQANGTIRWNVKNTCGKAVEVTFFDFDEKHRQLGKFNPFSTQPQPLSLADGAEGSATGVIRSSVDDGERGFHVFRYRIRIRTGNIVRDQDPEIIIEWP